MKIACHCACLLVAFTLASGTAMAEKADRNKPMNIEADALRYDDLNQVSVFTGRVQVTKGTIQIRGDQIEVRQDPQGYQFGKVTGSADKQAFFRQKREGLDEFIEGEGDLLEYDGKLDTVKFTKNAQLRRYRGASLVEEITGGVIVYENLTDMFSVDGSVSKGVSGVPAGRVRAMLTPKPDARAASTTQSNVQPAPVLRSANELEGVRK